MIYDVIIIGGGPAGITAGIYTVRRNLKTLIIEKTAVGGQILLAKEIGNYPGFQKISGIELSEMMEKQAMALGVEIVLDGVIEMNLKSEIKTIATNENKYDGKSVIIATGGEHRKLMVKGEKELSGRGVSYCATCDAPFFREKTVAVVGGGNTAVEDAVYLSSIAKKTYLIHRGGVLRADEAEQKKLADSNIEILLDTVVEEIIGKNSVDSIKIRSIKTNDSKAIKADGVFISVGIVPNREIAKNAGVELSNEGHIKTDENMETNIKGVFAAGDVTGGIMQIAKAIGDGCIAGLSAYKFVKSPYWGKIV